MEQLIKQNQEHLSFIHNALAKNEAYLFVGAGLSLNAVPKGGMSQNRFKTWPQFIYQLGSKLWPQMDKEDLEKKIVGEQLLIAQLFEEEFGFEAFYKELLRAVPYQEYVPSPIHKELLGLKGILHWKGFITTNQDCLIEKTLEDLHIYHDIVMSDLDISIKSAPVKLHKIHGSMERPESIVFTEEHYRTYESKHPLLHVKIKSIFAENTVVFVGFGLNDPNFKMIYGWVKDMLQTSYQKKAYAFVFEHEIDQYTKRYWEKRNIILLPIMTKGFSNSGRAFVKGMQDYIESLIKNTDNNFIPSEAFEDGEKLRNLFRVKEWGQSHTEELIYLLKSNKRLSEQLLWDGDSFFNNIFPTLDQHSRLSIIQYVYPSVNPLFLVKQKPIVDWYIELLELEALIDKEPLYDKFVDKVISLFRVGRYQDITKFVTDLINKYPELPPYYKNELLYWLIAVEKSQVNFFRIRELAQQITIDWNEPKWLNRMASIYLFLGENALALNMYNRVIQVAEDKKDEWNLYLSYLAKRHLLSHLEGSFMRQEKDLNNQMISHLYRSLTEQKNEILIRWQMFDELKTKWWSDYKKWKLGLGENKNGFHSMKLNAIHDVYEAIWFHEYYGFPHSALMNKKFDVFSDIFAENGRLEQAVKISIIFGFEKQVSTILPFDSLASVSDEEISNIYNYTIDVAERLNAYLQTKENSNHSFIELLLKTLCKAWEKMIPVLFDDQIKRINRLIWDMLFNLERANKRLMSLETNVVNVLELIIFFQNNENDKIQLLKWFEQNIKAVAFHRALRGFDWELFKGYKVFSNKTIQAMLDRKDSYLNILLYHFVNEEMVTEEQMNQIYKGIYNQNDPDCQLLLYPFFEDRLQENEIQKIILAGIEQFCTHQSSSDVNQLYRLAYLAKTMSKQQIDTLMAATEQKIEFASNEKSSQFMQVFSVEEITTAYLNFLYELYKEDQIETVDLINKMESYPNWQLGMADMLGSLSNIFEQSTISSLLLMGLQSMNPTIRKNYCFLTGYWMKGKNKIKEIDKLLIKHLIISLYDTSIQISSEAVRGIAWIIRDNKKLFTIEQLCEIINVTKDLKANQISYLTNLAFLYNEIGNVAELPDDVVTDVNKTRKILSEMRYANVRREIGG